MRARAGAFCPVLGVGNFCCCWTFWMKASRVCDVGQGGALEVDRSRLDPSSVFIASVGSVWASECRFLFCEMKHRLPPSTCNLFKVAERATNITSPFAIFVNLPGENFWMRLLSWRRGGVWMWEPLIGKWGKYSLWKVSSCYCHLEFVRSLLTIWPTWGKKKTFSYSSFYSKTVFLRCVISELS